MPMHAKKIIITVYIYILENVRTLDSVRNKDHTKKMSIFRRRLLTRKHFKLHYDRQL